MKCIAGVLPIELEWQDFISASVQLGMDVMGIVKAVVRSDEGHCMKQLPTGLVIVNQKSDALISPGFKV